MKTLRSLAIASFFLASAGLMLAVPSTSRADDGFRVTSNAGPHDSRVVTVALGHLIGIHVGHEHPHRYTHRTLYVHHGTHWHYGYRVPQWQHFHDQHCGHRVRYGQRVLVGDHQVHLTRDVVRVRPEHTKQRVKRQRSRRDRD